MRGGSLRMFSFITNVNVPVCHKCANYIPKYPYVPVNDLGRILGKCKKYGEMDVVSGEITYHYADLSRNNEKKCGIEGKYYEAISNDTNRSNFF